MTLINNHFYWPWVLLALIALPLLLNYYQNAQKQKAQSVSYHPDLSLLKKAASKKKKTTKLATILFTLAIITATISLARPTLNVPEAHPQAGIMLALDVSRSMAAYDILPNRFEAAKEAIKTFVKNLPQGTRVGLVTFAGYATPIVPLGQDHDRLLEAIDYLRMDYGTVIGDGLLSSLKGLPSLEQRLNLGDSPERFATIILLSDGRNFGGIDPLSALEEVKKQQVTVHTIGVGTLTDGPIPGIPMQYQFAARFDEPTMRKIATDTGGSFNFVGSAEELNEVYKDLSKAVIWRFGKEEATALGTLIAGILLFTSLSFNLIRQRLT